MVKMMTTGQNNDVPKTVESRVAALESKVEALSLNASNRFKE